MHKKPIEQLEIDTEIEGTLRIVPLFESMFWLCACWSVDHILTSFVLPGGYHN